MKIGQSSTWTPSHHISVQEVLFPKSACKVSIEEMLLDLLYHGTEGLVELLIEDLFEHIKHELLQLKRYVGMGSLAAITETLFVCLLVEQKDSPILLYFTTLSQLDLTMFTSGSHLNISVEEVKYYLEQLRRCRA